MYMTEADILRLTWRDPTSSGIRIISDVLEQKLH